MKLWSNSPDVAETGGRETVMLNDENSDKNVSNATSAQTSVGHRGEALRK